MDNPAPVNYALGLLGAVSHVAWKLEGAAGAALSFSELIKGYKCRMPSDLFRVKKHNALATDKEAEAWIVRRAISFLAEWLVIEGDTVRFKDGCSYDDLRYDGQPIARKGPDPYAQLRDPFDSMTGTFSDNIRMDLGGLDELRESMKSWGWVDRPQFRALGDKRGKVVLIGHRRIVVAKELGIDWEKHIDWVDLGEGDAADAERFKLAIVSNLGAKPLSVPSRKRLAMYLYSEQDWSMERVAEALNVTPMTISRDLGEFNIVLKSKRGRPKVKKPKVGPTDQALRALKAISELREEFGRDPTYGEVQAKTGLSSTPVRTAFAIYKFGAKLPEDVGQRQEVVTEEEVGHSDDFTDPLEPEPIPEPKPGQPHEVADRICPTCGQPWPHAATNGEPT